MLFDSVVRLFLSVILCLCLWQVS